MLAKSHERYAELISRFPDRSVIVLGDIMLDRYVEGTVERVSPEAPVVVLDVEREWCTTGGAGNVAKNVAALGAQAILISAMGVGPVSSEIYEAAEAEGYDYSYLFEDAGSRTTIKSRKIAQGQQLLRVDRNGSISEQARERLLRNFEVALSGVGDVIVSDYAKGILSEPLVRRVLALCRERGVSILGDIKPEHAQWFTGVDMLSPNEKEARAYVNEPKAELHVVACKVAELFDTTIFLTAGRQGIVVSDRGKKAEHVPQLHRFEVRDVTGCGDTVAAVIKLACLVGATTVEAAVLANAAAAVVATKVGAVAPSPQEVLTMLRS